MSSFLAELKKRNVFKVATIYIVVSWLILQVATIVFPVFDIPAWASRLVVILLAIGFPVALVLAWALDLTPEGIEWQTAEGDTPVLEHRTPFSGVWRSFRALQAKAIYLLGKKYLGHKIISINTVSGN